MRRLALVSLLVLLSGAVAAQNLDFSARPARSEPEWVNRLTMYEVWLSMFSAEGTLAGAIPRLPAVAELGVNCIYLSPIAKLSSKPNASPYNVADYNAIDPEYGAESDLRAFVGAAHKLGMKVMLDVVYYHSAPDNVMRQDAEFFVRDKQGQVVRGFWPQPLPDFSNPRVRQYLSESLVHWVRDFDVDGFRCDVAAGVPIAFWEQAREALDRVKPNVILLSEADRVEDQLQAFDINYNFNYYLTLRSVLRDGEPAVRVREHWERTRATFPRGARFLHFIDNHDWRRAVVDLGEKAALAASTLNFTLDGIPLLFNGQEIADATPTRWRGHAPIVWEPWGTRTDRAEVAATRERFKRLLRMRATEPALTSGHLVWINNTEPASVLSFLRKKGDQEVLVILNLSNRKVNVTLDLPVMEYYAVDNLLKEGKTWFPLYSGRVSAELAAYGEVVGKRIPHPPL
jgi:glycosidase